MKRNWLKLFILFLVYCTQTAIAAQREGEVYFMFGDSVLYDNYRSNFDALTVIEKIAKEIQPGKNLYITASASPEGEEFHNLQLTRKRISSIMEYIKNKTSLPDNRIVVQALSVDWGYALNVNALSKFPNKDSVYTILLDSTLDLKQKEHEISSIYGEDVVDYLKNNVYPYMRYGYVTTIDTENTANDVDSLVSNIKTNNFHNQDSNKDVPLFQKSYMVLGSWFWIILFAIIATVLYFLILKFDIFSGFSLKSKSRKVNVDEKDDHSIVPEEGGGSTLKVLKKEPMPGYVFASIKKENLPDKAMAYFIKQANIANKRNKTWHTIISYKNGYKSVNFKDIKVGPVVKAYMMKEIIRIIKSNPETEKILNEKPINRYKLKKIIRELNYGRLEDRIDREANLAPRTTRIKGYIGRLWYCTPHEDLNGDVYCVPIWAHSFYKHDGHVTKTVDEIADYIENK